jgi:Cu(I)/Ag(I) efflux system membrane protein CusA/SilA
VLRARSDARDCGCSALSSAWPLHAPRREFLPPLYEGDLLYMPSALPGLSPGKAARCCSRPTADRHVPEVKSVLGKIGRAETATDPAPLEMVETVVQLKPRSEWRPA